MHRRIYTSPISPGYMCFTISIMNKLIVNAIRNVRGFFRIVLKYKLIVPGSYLPLGSKARFKTTHIGFDVPKKFYTPKYIYTNPLFELTGAIHWEPQLTIDPNGKAIFKIVDTGIQYISFYIEGMSKDGSLISTIKTINLSEKSNP